MNPKSDIHTMEMNSLTNVADIICGAFDRRLDFNEWLPYNGDIMKWYNNTIAVKGYQESYLDEQMAICCAEVLDE